MKQNLIPTVGMFIVLGLITVAVAVWAFLPIV
jgi:hypothetical protein